MGKMGVNRDLFFLLIVGGLYSLGIFLSNTFVNIYLWKQAGDYMTIAVYNLAIFIFQPLTFILAGQLAKKIDRMVVLRIGVIFLSIFFLIVLIMREQASLYNFLLGSVLGVGYGFYWLAFNVLAFEITEPDTRDFFNGVLGVLESFGGMIGPLLAGLIISKMTDDVGYIVIFSISFIMFIFAIVCSFFLEGRQADGDFYFKEVLLERKNNKNWQRIVNSHIFQGLREGVFAFVITIWVYLTTQSELALGMFNLFLSGCSLIFYFIVTKSVTPAKRKKSIFLGRLLLYFALFIILIKTSYLTLMVYAVLIGIAYPVINVPYVSLTYDVIGKARNAKEMRIEYIVVRELFANIGRIISIVVLIVALHYFEPTLTIPLLLIVFGTTHLLINLLIKDIHLRPGHPQHHALVNGKIINEKNR